MLPLDALDELLVELGREFVGDVERLLDRHPQLVVHLVEQAGVAVLAGVPLTRGHWPFRLACYLSLHLACE